MREDHIFYLGLLAILVIVATTLVPNSPFAPMQKDCEQDVCEGQTPYAIKNIGFKNFGVPLFLIALVIVLMVYSIRKKYR